MPAGQVIGRVSVKVLPDTDDFRRVAQRELNKIEKTLKLTVATRVDMSGASREFMEELRKINQRNRVSDSRKIRFHTTISTDGMRETISKAVRQLNARASDRKIKIQADVVAAITHIELDKESLKQVAKELEDWRRDRDPIKIMVRPELVNGLSTVINTRLNYLARPRSVSYVPVINNAAAAKVATVLAALSGARVIHKYFDRISTSIKNLDKNIPIIGTLALAVAGLGGWALTATSNLFALSASLASIGPLALLLPGLIGGLAIGLGASVAVFKDFNTIFPQVGAALSDLQNKMSTNFWAEAKSSIGSLIDTLLPQFAAGLEKTSTALGGFFAGLADGLKGSLNPLLGGMFADLAESINIAAGSTGAMANIIAVLGSVGAGYLPQLAGWFASILTDFSAFLTTANNDGSLQGWIDTGISALSALGSALASIGGIFAGIARAATAGGGAGLETFAATLNKIQAIVEGPAFQTGMTAVFGAAHKAMSNIANGAGREVVTMFETLGNTLTLLLPIAGEALGTLFGALASALSNPALQTGLLKMFEGLNVAIQHLAPAFGPVATALGALAEVVAVMAPVFAELATAAFVPLAKAITTLAPAITPLISLLGGALVTVLTALGPVIGQVVNAFVKLLSGGIIPAITTVLGALVPVIEKLAPIIGAVLVTALNAIVPILPMLATMFTMLIEAIAPIIEQLLVQLAPLLPIIAQAFMTIIAAVMPLIPILLNLLSTILLPLIPLFAKIAGELLPKLAEAFASIVTAAMPMLAALAQLIAFLVPILIPVITFIADILITVLGVALTVVAALFSFMADSIAKALDFFVALFTGNWSKCWDMVKSIFSTTWEAIKAAFSAAFEFLKSIARKALEALKAVFSAAWNAIKSVASNVWGGIKSAFSGFLGALRDAPGAFLNKIKSTFSDAWNSIKSTATSAWDAVAGIFKKGIGKAVDYVKEFPGNLVRGLGNLGSTLKDAGRELIQGFIDGIFGMFGKVKDKLGELTDKLTSWKGPESLDRVILQDAGRLVIDGFINGLESRYNAVRKSLAGLTAMVGGTVIESPSIAGAAGISNKVAGALTASLGEGGGGNKTLNYYAAPGSSIDSEEDLFAAANRARMVGW